ncbi:NTP pyrophosphohydrolase [Hoeflea sp. IMCC20628]|uniref:CoA pyrophosphatase n=1 Tax=Hoeflea sp. IMCC20628 TaxID=1620421 RepID=UPI00063AC4F1|nr:CoA pyrophosphatase [Hoeflea sp. IMCC20628]AKH99386.1 NTP pyrophosphohydrolase [Hoeflea sp. IMCC20628]
MTGATSDFPLRFDAQDFRRRAHGHDPERAFGLEPAHLGHGDHVLNPTLVSSLAGVKLRDAAVLVPVTDAGTLSQVILTRRTTTMRKHSGQVAFPGGAIDPEDGSPEIAAMREAEEEIGLDRQFVEPIGRLPVYMTTTGFRITPVLAVVRPGYTITPNPDEVDAVFETPLSFLMDPANHKRESRVWDGIERHYFAMPFGPHRIWGVTAGIIRTMYERLYA